MVQYFLNGMCMAESKRYCLGDGSISLLVVIETKFKKMLAESENDLTKLSKRTIPATILCTSTYTRLWQKLFMQY